MPEYHRRLLARLWLVAGILALFAPPVRAQQGAPYQVGEAVEIEWPVQGEPRWVAATVTETRTSSVRARFRAADVGMYSSSGEMNEWMPHAKVRRPGGAPAPATAPAPAAAPAPRAAEAKPETSGADAASWRVGSEVDALSLGAWSPGRVLEVRAGEVKIRYDGHSERFDEWVPLARIRARRTSTAAASAPAVPAPKRITPGQYRCTENVARYTGSTYSPSTGSVAQYSYSLQSRGVLTMAAGDSYRIGGGPAHRFAYDAATGHIRWLGGALAGSEFNGGRYELDAKSGKPRIVVQLRTTRPTYWHCSLP